MTTQNKRMSIPYIRSQVNQLIEKTGEEKNKCGFAAWLTFPQIFVKGIQLILAVITIILLFVWESEGVKITTLDQDEYNYRNRVYYFVGVACITILYAVVMTVVGLAGIKIPSKALTFFAGVFLAMWLLAAPIFSATLSILENSVFARKKNLDILLLRIALATGFVLLVVFVSDILLGFSALRNSSGSETFKSEMKHSRSVLAAAKLTVRQSRRQLN